MQLTTEDIQRNLNEKAFATVVTRLGEEMSSRSMLFAYEEGHGVFLLTQKTTAKVKHMGDEPVGLVHVGEVKENLPESFDISIRGRFKFLDAASPTFEQGISALAAKNAMIGDLAKSPMIDDYALILMEVDTIEGWTYQQFVDGAPKTTIS